MLCRDLRCQDLLIFNLWVATLLFNQHPELHLQLDHCEALSMVHRVVFKGLFVLAEQSLQDFATLGVNDQPP